MQKLQQSAQHGPREIDEILCSNVFFCFLFFVIACAALENTFLGVSPPFLRQMTCSGDD